MPTNEHLVLCGAAAFSEHSDATHLNLNLHGSSANVRLEIGDISRRLLANISDIHADLLEPISKSSEEDNEACELDKAEEVLSVVLPADEYATLPLYPGEEALDEPAPLVTA